MALKIDINFLFSISASSENIQIQGFPETVIYKKNDLLITCSITTPSELSSISFIQLQKNYSTTFDTVVSVATGQTPNIQWKDSALQRRASATGSIDSPSTAQLRLTIDKSYVQCSDFNMYKCKMSGFGTASVAVTQETNPITISYIGMYTNLNSNLFCLHIWSLFIKFWRHNITVPK